MEEKPKPQFTKETAKGCVILIVIAILIGIFYFTCSDDKKPVKENTISTIGIGQILHTKYFDIVVNEILLKDRVNTGNQYANLKPEPGNMYLILNVSFKNIDTESRMVIEGSIWINSNGKDYELDQPEEIMLEGWGLFLDQINPLTTKTTNLVYKIPAEIKGKAYWQPGRANSDEKISLGELK